MTKIILLSFLILFSEARAHTIRYLKNAPLKIIKIGHPALRQVAEEVPFADIVTEKMQKLFDDMIETMYDAQGVGLAAPQVNVSKRIFVMGGATIPTTVVVNPKVRYLDEYGKKDSREGCLSIPGRRVRIKRFKRLHLDYINRLGDYVSREVGGFEAIVVQHEYDHLNGVLMIDLLLEGAEIVWPKNLVEIPLM